MRGSGNLKSNGDIESETLIAFGGEVKALSEDGRVGGFLVLFTGEGDPDLTADFFTGKSDYGSHKSTPIYYDHGMDTVLGRRELGTAEIKIVDAGVWLEGQLDMRDEYEKAVYGLVKAGKLGWSSGTAAHLVEREKSGKAMWVKKWPLGLDASLTPTPCEPRTQAVPLKSYAELKKKAKQESLLGDYVNNSITSSALRVLNDALWSRIYDHLWSLSEDGGGTEPSTDAATLRKCFDEFRDRSLDVITKMLASDAKSLPVTLKGLSPHAGQTLDDHSEAVLAAVQGLTTRARSLAELRAQDGRRLSGARLAQVKAVRDELDALLAIPAKRSTPDEVRALQIDLLRMQADVQGLLGART